MLCGFYVAQADSKLFNTSSKVVLARDGDQTAITMASDFEGDAKEFAVVVPVPTFIERKQIGVVDPGRSTTSITIPRLAWSNITTRTLAIPPVMVAATAMPVTSMAQAVQRTHWR